MTRHLSPHESLQLFLGSTDGWRLEVARGLVPGIENHHHTGANPSVAASSTEVVSFAGGSVTFLTVADELRVKANGNVNDDVGGSGATSILIIGLDNKFEHAEAIIDTNGTSASGLTPQKFIRIQHVEVHTVGTYGEANTGDIVIETEGGTTLATIEAGRGASQSGVFTIPAHHTGYMTRLAIEVDANKPLDVYMYSRDDANVTSGDDMHAKHLQAEFRQLEFEAIIDYTAYIEFHEKTDIWVEAVNGSGASGAVVVDWDLIIVNDGLFEGHRNRI